VNYLEEEAAQSASPEEVHRGDQELTWVMDREVKWSEWDSGAGSEERSCSRVVLGLPCQLPSPSYQV
jgi:hypothetical protein